MNIEDELGGDALLMSPPHPSQLGHMNSAEMNADFTATPIEEDDTANEEEEQEEHDKDNDPSWTPLGNINSSQELAQGVQQFNTPSSAGAGAGGSGSAKKRGRPPTKEKKQEDDETVLKRTLTKLNKQVEEVDENIQELKEQHDKAFVEWKEFMKGLKATGSPTDDALYNAFLLIKNSTRSGIQPNIKNLGLFLTSKTDFIKFTEQQIKIKSEIKTTAEKLIEIHNKKYQQELYRKFCL